MAFTRLRVGLIAVFYGSIMMLGLGYVAAYAQDMSAPDSSFDGGSFKDDPNHVNVAPPREPILSYVIPLEHMTPYEFMDELSRADVPGCAVVILKPGEVARNTFKVDGMMALIPNERDNSLGVLSTPDAFVFIRDLVHELDIPAKQTPSVTAPSAKKIQSDRQKPYGNLRPSVKQSLGRKNMTKG
jgi:hypothetical protein